jgi:hypothetical protein
MQNVHLVSQQKVDVLSNGALVFAVSLIFCTGKQIHNNSPSLCLYQPACINLYCTQLTGKPSAPFENAIKFWARNNSKNIHFFCISSWFLPLYDMRVPHTTGSNEQTVVVRLKCMKLPINASLIKLWFDLIYLFTFQSSYQCTLVSSLAKLWFRQRMRLQAGWNELNHTVIICIYFTYQLEKLYQHDSTPNQGQAQRFPFCPSWTDFQSKLKEWETILYIMIMNMNKW